MPKTLEERKQQQRESAHKWYINHKEHARAYQKKYRAEHKEEIKQRRKKYHYPTTDAKKRYYKAYYQANKERLLDTNKELYYEKLEQKQKYQREWYLKHRAEILAKYRERTDEEKQKDKERYLENRDNRRVIIAVKKGQNYFYLESLKYYKVKRRRVRIDMETVLLTPSKEFAKDYSINYAKKIIRLFALERVEAKIILIKGSKSNESKSRL